MVVEAGLNPAPTGARLRLAARIQAEMRLPAQPAAVALARQLAARAPGGVAAVLFYGSALRDDALDGVLDFYVLTDQADTWPATAFVSFAGRLLPPNVGYLETAAEAGTPALRAKFAVMTMAQFRRAMSPSGIDTTLWARFSQPCRCLVARSDADAAEAVDAVVDALVTAARWAAALGPLQGPASAFWRALFARTYAAELRVERSGRSADIVARDESRYTALLADAWVAGGLGVRRMRPALPAGAGAGEAAVDAEDLQPVLDDAARARESSRWRLRQRLGRPLNLLRLLKAALTFDNAIDYVAWKIERHSGVRIEPTAFQRRHPLLAAPALYWRLRALKVLR